MTTEKPIPDSQRLSFTANAVREHFEGDEGSVAEAIRIVEDSKLTEIGEYALLDDRIYRAFHEALEDAARDVLGIEEAS